MKKKSTKLVTAVNNLEGITTYQAGIMQASTHRKLQQYCDKILKQYGITKMQWLIIGTVLDGGEDGVRITDAASKIDTTLPYLTTAINLLESKGMLVRKDSGTDSRSKLITVDPTFKPQCIEIESTLREALRQTIYAQIEPGEFRTYIKVLYQLSQVDLGDK